MMYMLHVLMCQLCVLERGEERVVATLALATLLARRPAWATRETEGSPLEPCRQTQKLASPLSGGVGVGFLRTETSVVRLP